MLLALKLFSASASCCALGHNCGRSRNSSGPGKGQWNQTFQDQLCLFCLGLGLTAATTYLRQEMRHRDARLRCYDLTLQAVGATGAEWKRLARCKGETRPFLDLNRLEKEYFLAPGRSWGPEAIPVGLRVCTYLSCHLLCSSLNFCSHSRASPKDFLTCLVFFFFFLLQV